MPLHSASQGRLMGLVHICQKYGKCLSGKIKDVASHIKPEDASEMAHMKRKSLPDRVKKKKKKHKYKSFKEYVQERENEERDT